MNEQGPDVAVTVPESAYPLLEVDSGPSFGLYRDRQVIGHIVGGRCPLPFPLDIRETCGSEKLVGLMFTFTAYAAGRICHGRHYYVQKSAPQRFEGLFCGWSQNGGI